MIKVISIIVATLFTCYIAFTSAYFYKQQQGVVCSALDVVIRNSTEKNYITKNDLINILDRAKLNPIKKPISQINTHKIEMELLRHEMLSVAEAYKTPSGKVCLTVEQKHPILRILSPQGNYYIDKLGNTMAVSSRAVAYVPIVTGYVEKKLALTNLYQFALLLQKNDFWNNQIAQIHVHPNKEVELIPRVGNFRIILGELTEVEEKLNKLELFYEQAIKRVGWEKYSIINLKYKNQVVCTRK